MAQSENRKNIEILNKYIDRLQAVQKQLEQLDKGTDSYNKKLAEKNRLEGKASKASKELSKSQGKLNSTLPKHRKLIDESAKAQSRYNKTVGTSTKANTGFLGKLGKTISMLGRLGIAYKVIQGFTALFNEAFVQSAKRAIAFEKAMADLGAVVGLTAEELGKLEGVVFEVAGTTSFTAIQIAELQKQLGKLGASADEIAQLTKPVALLSQALGEEPGGVAESLKKALNQFDATSESAGEFANVMVGAVNESALSLNDLGTALQYVGPLAGQVGLTFDETAAFLGILANNGLKASRAGTGLRNILSEAAKQGIPFKEFVQELAENNLDAAESFEIFGKRGAGAAVVLAENIEEFEKLNEEVKDSTRLLRANATQMSSTQGQIDLLSSAYNRASIRLGDYITRTEFFIEIIERLDPLVAGQARAYKAIANASEESAKDIDLLTRAMSDFRLTQEEQVNVGELTLKILEDTGQISKEVSDDIRTSADAMGKSITDVVNNMTAVGDNAEEINDARLAFQGLSDVLSGNAKAVRENRIATEAANENYKEAVKLTDELTDSAKRGVLTDKEQIRVTEGLEEKLTKLQEQREKSKDKEEIIILEKRISLFEGLVESVKNLENSEKAVTAGQKKNAQDQLAILIQSIKDQEKVIAGLSEFTTTEEYLTQVNVLNSLFGDIDSFRKDIEERFGSDSEFVKQMNKSLSDALNTVSVAAKKELPDLELIPELDFGEDFDNTVTKVAKTLPEKLKEAFEGVRLADVIGEALDKAAESISAFNDTALQNTKGRLEAEKSSIENRYKTEEDILKSQLNNQLITEGQFRAKQRELQQSKISEQNEIDRKLFDAQKKRDKQNATTDYLQSLASIIPNLIINDKEANPVALAAKAAISAALTSAAYTAELAAIGKRKFFPKKFEQGGMVDGPSHAQGGVPFSVQGRGGYEMEGGEFIVNKNATAKHRNLLERINNSSRTQALLGKQKFAQGGLVGSMADESVDYLKAIAEATTSTAIQTSKPVRAFVSSKDLRGNETERRLRDRNDRV